LALLAVVVVAVFAFGRHNPSPPSLQGDPRPEIPGEILYVDQDFCLVAAAASAVSRSSPASPVLHGRPALLDRRYNREIIRYDQRDSVLWHVDLKTGAMTDTGKSSVDDGKLPPDGIYGGTSAPDGAFASVDQDGRLSVLVDGKRTGSRLRYPGIQPAPGAHLVARFVDGAQYYRARRWTQIWIVARGAVRAATKDAASGRLPGDRGRVQPPNPR
jgi:hypothetical protein